VSRVVERLFGAEDGDRAPLGATLAILTAVGIAVGWAWPFLAEAERVPPSQDLAWYVWRSSLLMEAEPRAFIELSGPLGAWGGAYRLSGALTGALVRRLTGVNGLEVSVLLVAGRAVVGALALGALAYRIRRDALMFSVVTAFAAAMTFLNHYLGFVDNMLALLYASVAAILLPEARTSWPHRIAVGACVFLGFFAHPPASGAFVVAVIAIVAVRLLFVRPRGAALRQEGVLVLTLIAAAAAAYLAWRLGIWGPGRSFGDAVHPPPLQQASFLGRATKWIVSTRPLRLVPLLLLGMTVLLLPWRRFSRDVTRRLVVVWSLAVAGFLLYPVGPTFPYWRFLNVTIAPVIVAGIGVYVLSRPLVRLGDRGGPARIAGPVAGLAVAAALISWTWMDGRTQLASREPWTEHRASQATLAAVAAYAEREDPSVPLVFVMGASPDAGPTEVWSDTWKGAMHRIRAALPGRIVGNTFTYYGGVSEFLARRPARFGNEIYQLVSVASLEDLQAGVGDREAVAILIHSLSEERQDSPAYFGRPRSVPLGPEVSILKGPGLAAPSPDAVEAARAVAEGGAPSGRPWAAGRLLVALLGASFFLVIPGAFAARALGIRGVPMLLGTVPALSLILNQLWGMGVLAVVRSPLSPGLAWAVSGLATASAIALWLSLRGRAPAIPPPREESAPEEEGERTR
jgi:hypothetical protein